MERIIYDYCAVIGIDGMGSFNRLANTPNLDRIFENGAVTYDALSMNPTISAENWGAMLLGSTPLVHGLTNGYISTYEYSNKELPSVFTRLRRAFPDAYLTSVVNWNPINHGIVEHDVDADLATAENDDDLTPMIVERVARKPKFLFVQFDDVDGAGHSLTYGSPEYLKAVEHADSLVGQIFDAYEKAGILDRTLFVVTADHGGIRRGHGTFTETERKIFLGVRGPGVVKSQIGYARTKDIAAIVLYSLGVDLPEYDADGFSSQVPVGIFPWEYAKYRREHTTPVIPENKPTPAIDADDGLFSYFGKDKVKFAMFFDDRICDETGGCAFEEINHIKYYSNGVRGACGEFGVTGYAVAKNGADVGSGSFSVAVWLKLDDSLAEGAVICSSKDWWWQNRKETGFAVVLTNNATNFSVSNGTDNVEVITPVPGELTDGWVHLTAVYDKENKQIRIYHDFRFIRAVSLGENMIADIKTEKFVVGNDAGHQHNDKTWPCIFRMDDLLIFDGAFDENDVKKLEEYYK